MSHLRTGLEGSPAFLFAVRPDGPDGQPAGTALPALQESLGLRRPLRQLADPRQGPGRLHWLRHWSAV